MKKLLLLLGLMSCVYSFGQCPGDTQAPYSGVASGSTSISQRGRTSTYTNVNLNGTGTNEAFVTPGATVTFSYDYSMVYNTGGACPTCPTQHFVGMNNVFSDCHEEGTGNISTSFTAPTAEGSYYITQSSDWAVGCYAFNSFDPNNSYAAVAVLHVGAPSLIPPANVVVNSTTAGCTTVVNGIRIVAIDDCADPITLTYDITGATTGTGTGDASGTTFNAGISTVTYTATDSSLNTSTATFTVTVTGTTGTISSQTNVSCNGNTDGAATIDVTGGITPYTYLWSDGQTTATATGLAAGDYTVTVTDAVGCATIVDVTITEPTALAITPSQVNILCNGAATGEATVSVTGGTGTYTYLWSDGQTTATATGLTAGSYSVTVTDANSCTLIENFTITELPALTATPTGVDIVCNGDASGSASVAVTGGSAPYTYLWNTTETTATISNLTAGIYTVDIEDANGCTTSASVTINESPALVVNETHTDVQCNGNDTGVASVIVTGGATPYTYLWNTGETTATITSLVAATYSVDVTDANGCVATQTIVISEPTPLASTPAQTNILCNGDTTGSASLTITGGVAPYSYLWDTGDTTDNITNLAAGNYFVTVTDANGCTLTQLYTIDEPAVLSVNPTQTNILCNGAATGVATATVSGGTAPYTYLWNNGETTPTISGLVAGNYSVGITDANGCTISQSFNITQPTALTATNSQSNIACNGEDTGVASVTVSGGVAPYTYAWSNGETTAAITGLTAGTYTVEVTDANGCTLTRSFDIQQPTALNATSSQVNVLCNGAATGEASVTMTGGIPPYSYLWDDGQTTPTATGLFAGAHSVFVTDANGCTLTQSITITEPTALVSTPNTTQSNVLCNGGTSGNATIVIEGGVAPYSYLWSNGQTTLTATGLVAGTYTVTVTDANGCTLTQDFDITEPAALTSAPSQTNIICNGNATGAASVVINGGVQPYTYEWNTGANTDAISGLVAGNYFVTVTDANGCILIQNFNISQPNALAVGPATTQTDILCNGAATGSATIDVTGGTTPYTYAWSDGQTTATATGLTAGTYDVLVTDANGCTLAYQFEITQPDALVLTATQTDVLCNGNNTGEATISVEGGVTPYTYLWNNGEVTSTITGLVAGTYTVDVTDANGCSLTQVFTITEPELLTGTPSQVDVLCNGNNTGEATITMQGGVQPYTYAWSNGGDTATVSNLTAGTYSVVVTDVNGCSITQDFTITEPELLTVTIDSTNITCFNAANGTATAIVAGGVLPYQYAWSNGETTDMIENLTPGAYTVTITDANGCTATATVIITQPLQLTGFIAQTNVSCNGGSNGTATANANGGTAPYTYLWSNGLTTQTITALTAGSYNVTITDVNGCQIIKGCTISQPSPLYITAGQTNPTCIGAAYGEANVTAVGGVMPYTYLWSNGATTANITGLTAGTYSVFVTDANGCSNSANVTIQGLPAATFNAQPVDDSTPFDGDAHFMVDVANAYSYQWQESNDGGTTWYNLTDGGVNPTYLGVNTNMLSVVHAPLSLNNYQYRVVINEVIGCGASSQAATLLIRNRLWAEADDFSNVEIHEGTGGAAGDVTLNDLYNYEPVDDNDITISIVNDGGLTGVTVDADGIITVPATATEGTYVVNYQICDNNNPDDNPDNCREAQVIIVVLEPLPLGVDDFLATGLEIYPNPATTEVFIKIPMAAGSDNMQLNVYDINGRLVKQQTVTTGTNKVDIDALEAAQYIFNITTDNGSVSKKVIKYRP